MERYKIVRGRLWVALAVRLPERVAKHAPAPVACMGAGLTRDARAEARDAVTAAAWGLL